MSDAATPVAQVDDLCFGYPQRPLFTRWSACFPAGLTCVLGDDGSGKTSLLRLIGGDLAADSGRLQVAGTWLHTDAAAYRAQVFRTDPQSELPQQISPRAWLDTVAARHATFDRAAVPDLLARLSLVEHQDKPLYMLSTGSRRKVWLVAAFAAGVPLTLIDQPFAALDKASIAAVASLLDAASRQPGRATVVADYTPLPGLPAAQTITLD